MDQDTIAAIATPFGSGGIGIIRISGPHSASIASKMFLPRYYSSKATASCISDVAAFESHRLYLGDIIDTNRQIVDEVLLTIMHAPHSYTCEDVVEIQSHAGHIVLKTILRLTVSLGARLALPGEFTKRAFLNGRIDLTQAEATIDIINAKTDQALQLANAQMQGQLKSKIMAIKKSVLDLAIQIEAAIDFPDDVGDLFEPQQAIKMIVDEIQSPIQHLIKQHDTYGFIREGLRIAILGAPNVGKSSLMNCLLNKERSIVTDQPGTTRDIIEDSLQLNGMPLIVSDTAGLHLTNDPVETIGIRKARDTILKSDLILFVVDAASPEPFTAVHHLSSFSAQKAILVLNKIDLIKDNDPFVPPAEVSQLAHVRTSALFNQGIDQLKSAIVDTVFTQQLDPSATVVPNLRHRQNLTNCVEAVQAMLRLIESNAPSEIMAIELSSIIDQLDEILGETVKVDLLDLIFDTFCIGK